MTVLLAALAAFFFPIAIGWASYLSVVLFCRKPAKAQIKRMPNDLSFLHHPGD